ncbi:hypothetical protein MMC14_003744, partial [Varicellaria rhodocarpa]|nr:hypothetical protein [Varicellaria rhodocarpa]
MIIFAGKKNVAAANEIVIYMDTSGANLNMWLRSLDRGDRATARIVILATYSTWSSRILREDKCAVLNGPKVPKALAAEVDDDDP